MYCGDETGAFIGDVGSHTARFGYGGEDCPKVVIPSVKNLSACMSDNDVGLLPIYSSLNSNASHQKSNLNNNDGTIQQDIDAWASLWEYSYSALCVRGKGKHTRGYKYEPELQPEEGSPKLSQTIISSSQQQSIDGPIDHPLLAVDSTSRTISTAIQEKQRAQMLETLFESLSAPAAYIAPSPMLSSFAYGRSTALVIDIGHSGSRVTPLVDGHCLSSGSVSSGRGAKWLGNIQQSVLEGTWTVDGTSVVKKWNGWKVSDEGDAGMPPSRGKGIIPRYLLPSSEKYSQSKMQLLKQSPFHSMAIHEVMYEMMTSSHMLPLDITKSETAPFCGYGEVREDMATDNDVVMAEDKKEEENEEEEDEDSEEPTYVLPDGTSVNLTKSKAGKDLCRLPVSSTICISLHFVIYRWLSIHMPFPFHILNSRSCCFRRLYLPSYIRQHPTVAVPILIACYLYKSLFTNH